jgi:hypothetical protein
MEAAARAYFSAWNDKSTRASNDGASVGAFFAPAGVLRDWDVHVEGGPGPVGAANAKIFAAVPDIQIEVLAVSVAEAARVATCEIIVHVNNSANETLKVADVIEFELDSLLFKRLYAYKG